MDGALQRAQERLADAAAARARPADVDAALERARAQVEALAQAAAALEATVPERVAEAVREQARPLGRGVAEIRGLANQTIRRLERLETELLAERNARVDDLALLVDLIASSWRGADARLRRIEEALQPGATVYQIAEAS